MTIHQLQILNKVEWDGRIILNDGIKICVAYLSFSFHSRWTSEDNLLSDIIASVETQTQYPNTTGIPLLSYHEFEDDGFLIYFIF